MNEETELMNYQDFSELAKRKEGIVNKTIAKMRRLVG